MSIYLLVLSLLLQLAATTGVAATQQIKHSTGLYLGWLGHYNAGDDVVFYEIEKIISSTALQLNPPIAISLHPYYPVNPCEQVLVDLSQYDFIVLGGGSILTQDEYACQLTQAVALNLPLFVGGSGWDPRTPLRNGDSFSLDPVWKARFQRTGHLGYGGVRGPMTLMAVSNFFPNTKLISIGDAGMLLNPNDYTLQYPTFIPKDFITDQYIAVGHGQNIGDSIYHQNINGALDQAMVSFVVHEITVNHRNIILYAMDGPSLSVMDQIHRHVVATLQNEGEKEGDKEMGRLYLIKQVLDAGSSCQLFYHAEATVNYKLHGSVISGGMGTPYVAMAYHFKSWDFASDLQDYPDEFTINTNDVELNWKLLSDALLNVLVPKKYMQLKEILKKSRERTRLRWTDVVNEFLNVLNEKLEGRESEL